MPRENIDSNTGLGELEQQCMDKLVESYVCLCSKK